MLRLVGRRCVGTDLDGIFLANQRVTIYVLFIVIMNVAVASNGGRGAISPAVCTKRSW